MTFEELLALLQGGEAPETIYDDLSASYNGMAEGSAAKVSQLEAALEEANQKLVAVMAHNYELLTAVPAEGNPADPAPSADDDEIDDEDMATFADLISYE
jgi:hypothetical protein